MYLDHELRKKFKRFKVVDVFFAKFVVLIHREWFTATAEQNDFFPLVVMVMFG